MCDWKAAGGGVGLGRWFGGPRSPCRFGSCLVEGQYNSLVSRLAVVIVNILVARFVPSLVHGVSLVGSGVFFCLVVRCWCFVYFRFGFLGVCTVVFGFWREGSARGKKCGYLVCALCYVPFFLLLFCGTILF